MTQAAIHGTIAAANQRRSGGVDGLAMARGLKLVVALVVVVAAMMFLAGRAGEQPQVKQEQPVDLDALAK
jgi:hypothetical protein